MHVLQPWAPGTHSLTRDATTRSLTVYHLKQRGALLLPEPEHEAVPVAQAVRARELGGSPPRKRPAARVAVGARGSAQLKA